MKNNRRKILKGIAAAASLPLLSFLQPNQVFSANKLRRIAVEETFSIPEIIDAIEKLLAIHPEKDLGTAKALKFVPGINTIKERLIDLDDHRIKEMDKAGVDVALLSLWSPGVQLFDKQQAIELAELANDRLTEAIKRHPNRYGGLITIAPQDPQKAAQEIERGITRLHLNGVLINSHTNGEFLDNKKFWPVFEAAVAHKVPIYLHPRTPPESMYKAFADYTMDGAMWGFALESSTHVLRMILGGVFDEFPELKIVLGHMGEGIPYWLSRIDTISSRDRKTKRAPSEYFLDNFSITTSGMSWDPVLEFNLKVLGPERIMFAVDYPYVSYDASVRWMDKAPISQVHREMIYHKNAERIFNL